jgi:hypothetical protein
MGRRIDLKPRQAWIDGTNIRKALKHDPETVRAYVMKEVASLCKEMDMNKTITTDDEMSFVCRTILDDFPAMKIEEIRLALNRIRKGEVKLYERLKGPEILLALKEYEGIVRAPILEELNRMHKDAGKMKGLPQWASRMKEWIPDAQDFQTPPGHGLGSRLRKHLDVKEEGKS